MNVNNSNTEPFEINGNTEAKHIKQFRINMFLITYFSLSPNPYVVSVGKEPVLTMYHFSPMRYHINTKNYVVSRTASELVHGENWS